MSHGKRRSQPNRLRLMGVEAMVASRPALINVTPHEELYTGFPFFFVGLYIDRAAGTGIDVN